MVVYPHLGTLLNMLLLEQVLYEKLNFKKLQKYALTYLDDHDITARIPAM